MTLGRRHAFPLKGRMRLGHKGRGVDGNAPLETLPCRQREVDQRLDIVVGLGGMADHEVELQLREVELLCQRDGAHHLIFGLRLVDDVAQPLAAGLRRHRQVARTGLGHGADQGHADGIHAHGTGADAGAHPLQARWPVRRSGCGR